MEDAVNAMVSAEKLLSELAGKWADLGKESVEQSQSGVLRACAMNLLVCVEGSEDLSEILAEVVHEDPSRLIVVRALPDGDAPSAELSGRVLTQCWMPFGRRQQICCEQIEITASKGQLGDVASIARGLWEADLPIVIWFRNDGLLLEPGLQPLIAMAHKVIVDTRSAAEPRAALRKLRALAAEGKWTGDLAWTRLTRWRSAIAQVFENPGCRKAAASLHTAKITHNRSRAPMSARYLAAWIRQSLPDQMVDVTFASGGADHGWELHQVELLGEAVQVAVTRKDQHVVEVAWNGFQAAHVFPVQSDSVLLREELRILGRDPLFEAALTGL
jgi:glucose-6-phosphate dehydrogenase assembly protein OpcA